jgi:putative transposase
MPWQELTPVDLRMRFVSEWHTGNWSMTDLCAEYAVSRKTGYKWLDRYAESGPSGLHDQSRRPEQSPHASDPGLVQQLIDLRTRHPTWGARKLLTVAQRDDPDAAWPSRSTVCAVLKARGLVHARRHRHACTRLTVPLAPMTEPNATWTTDFKGEFRTGDGVYCYPLTLRDGFSRYVLRCDALLSTGYAGTRRCFERAFAEYGLPERIRSDNGGPFASTGFAGLSRLSVWWLRLGIGLERTAPSHPEQNGSHEQFHHVLKAETARPPAATAGSQQQRFTRFRTEYNCERPHEALGDQVPAQYYQPSARRLPAHLPPLDYPGHWEARTVSCDGAMSWRGAIVFVGEALAGERVGLEEVDDGVWTIHFATVPLGRFDERQRRVYPIVGCSAGRSASAAGSAPNGRKRQ